MKPNRSKSLTLAWFAGLVLTLLPLIRALLFAVQNGVNHPSNDDWILVQVIDKVLDGTYDWRYLLRDSLHGNGQWLFLPMLLQGTTAVLTGWNGFEIIYLGFFLGAIKVGLLYILIRPFLSAYWRPWVLALFSFFVFSPTQISNYEYELGSLAMGCYQIGFLLGLWGLATYPRRTQGLGIAILGGSIATLSWGGGGTVWIPLGFGLWAFGFRRRSHYLCFISLAAALVGFHAYSLHQYFSNPVRSSLMWPDPNFVLKGIGLPMGGGLWTGVGGLIATALSSAAIFKLPKESRPAAILGSILCGAAVFTILQISFFRSILSPWYSTPMMLFWIGLSFQVLIVLSCKGRELRALRVGAGIMLGGILLLYGVGNRNFEGHSFFLQFKKPVSASCLRDYQDAPTYCGNHLVGFAYGLQSYISSFGAPLAKHALSLFGRNQTWLLQGDWVLDRVKIRGHASVAKAYWGKERAENRLPFADYHEMNLFLRSPGELEWRVLIPKNTRTAWFKTAIGPGASAKRGMTFGVDIKSSKGTERVFTQYLDPKAKDWLPIRVNLTAYAGQEIQILLILNSSLGSSGSWGVFQHPQIELDVERKKSPTEKRKPTNTELGKAPTLPGDKDYVFSLTGDEDSLTTPLCLAAYRQLYLKLALPEGVFPRSTCIQIALESNLYGMADMTIPLLEDGKTHEYTYDLRLLELEPNTLLKGIRFQVVCGSQNTQPGNTTIQDLRLIYDPESTPAERNCKSR